MNCLKIIFLSFCISLGYALEYNNSMSRSYKGFICENDLECNELIGSKSTCLFDQCQCTPHHHINNKMLCIKDRGLKEFCQLDDECYWGPEMVDKIECSLGVCSCVHGYVPDQGKICVKYFHSGATVIHILPSFIFSLIAMVIFAK